MKLSVSYNFFNGEEHLAASVRSIRHSVDYITIIYQKISNSGEPISQEALDVLQQLKDQKLVDAIYNYRPNLKKPRRYNELKKRKIGLRMAFFNRCTHFFTMDADEFYRKDELDYAKQYIEKNGVVSSSVDSFFHLRSAEWRAKDTTKCAFITAITWRTKLGIDTYPIDNVDSTRKLSSSKGEHYHFGDHEIAMYHMNFVRKDKMRSKLKNTSTTDTDFLHQIEHNINTWKPGEIFPFPNKGEYTLIKVENEFDTFLGESL